MSCKHSYKYISTERIPTDQWNYGERIYKEEIIAYCPLCHTHTRMSRDEWNVYNGLAATLNRRYRETPVCKFDKDKTATFTANNSIINLNIFNEV